MKKLNHVICDVCRVILNKDNQHEKQSKHFVDVCKEHREFANTFLIDVVAEKLGFKDIEKGRKCKVCEKTITDIDVLNSLNVNSFHFLCEKHLKKYAKMYKLV